MDDVDDVDDDYDVYDDYDVDDDDDDDDRDEFLPPSSSACRSFGCKLFSHFIQILASAHFSYILRKYFSFTLKVQNYLNQN